LIYSSKIHPVCGRKYENSCQSGWFSSPALVKPLFIGIYLCLAFRTALFPGVAGSYSADDGAETGRNAGCGRIASRHHLSLPAAVPMRMILGQLTIWGIVSTLPVAVITYLMATYWLPGR
jgi:hypothetical protein